MHDQTSRPMIIVGGCARSGTTMLRLILNSHRNIACGPEAKAAPAIVQHLRQFQSSGMVQYLMQEYRLSAEHILSCYGQLFQSLLEPYRRQAGKPRLAEKTPLNILYFDVLARMLPESPMIHIIRDGRDVVASLLKQKWVDMATRKPLPYTQNLADAAAFWVQCVRAGRSILNLNTTFPIPIHKKYIELRYEDIVTKPEPTLRDLFSRLDEPWDPAVLCHHEQSHHLSRGDHLSHGKTIFAPIDANRRRRWEAWSASERDTFKQVAGDLLIELDYAENNDW